MSLLPTSWDVIFDEDAVKSGDLDQLVNYIRRLTIDVGDMYTSIAEANNAGIDYTAQSTEPTPDSNQAMFWYDTANFKRYLMYNDNGNITKVELT